MATKAQSNPSAQTKPTTTQRPEPFGMVIFGATGDLTARKLVPALFDLAHLGSLPDNFYILGIGRRDWNRDTFRQRMKEAVEQHSRFAKDVAANWDSFARHLDFFRQDATNEEAYNRLGRQLEKLDQQHVVPPNHVFYLSVPPGLYPEIVGQLGAAGLAAAEKDSAWTRIIIEKPFGHDCASARRLNAQVQEAFREEQVYRIDHYLGKETVQNLMVFRFANGIFEPVWNRNHIDHVQISVVEDLGVEHRAGFYETAGVVRDMVQNHLLQLLCLVAMEPPSSFEAERVHQEKIKVLHALRPFDPGRLEAVAVRGQYGPGTIAGKKVPGYREEKGVAPDSATETFAALKLELDNWRWASVPFYLRTGKRLPQKTSQISIQFRDAPLHLFACTAMQPCEPNRLTLRLQPDEGIDLRILAKKPGLEVAGQAVEMDFSYAGSFKQQTPSAYETLLLDCLEGDRMLFAVGEWVETAWGFLDPLLKAWAEKAPQDFPNYAAGTWGPSAAQRLINSSGNGWHLV
jgi:glucose-6-phosphate 1-dehydrogenase